MFVTRFPLAPLFALSLIVLQSPASAAEVRAASRAVNHAFSGNLSLDEAVQIALRQNPEILKQLQEIRRTRGQIVEVRAEALPHLTLQTSYTQQDKELIDQGSGSAQGNSASTPLVVVPVGNVAPETTKEIESSFAKIIKDLGGSGGSRTTQNKSWQVAIEAQQVIYSGGQISAAIKIAKFTEDAAYYQLRDIIDQVIASVRTQFTAVLTTRALITVAEETVKLQQDQLKDQKNRFDAGTVPKFNVLRAEVELANVQPDLIRARNNYLIAEINLAKTLGLDPGPMGKPGFNAVGELLVVERPFGLQNALDLARARRPFLKVQRQQILSQAERIKVALAGYKPSLNANVGYEFRNSRFSEDLGDEINGWFFGVTGKWNLFDGLATSGKVQQARAQLESAKINYDDSVQKVDLEVQQAYANLETARETIKSQQKNVEQALESLRLAQERFGAGAGTQLEVLDARTALTKARSTELQSRGDYNTALAEFDRATATDTIYAEPFADPLQKNERRALGKAPAEKAAAKPQKKS